MTRTKSPRRNVCAIARKPAAAQHHATMSSEPPVGKPSMRIAEPPIITAKIAKTNAAASQAAAS